MEIKETEHNGFKFYYYKSDNMAMNSIDKQCIWEPHILKFVAKLGSLKNIIDIGANFGYHSIMLSKYVENFVYAFEPQIQNYELLKRNKEVNELDKIIIFNEACGSENTHVYMPVIANNATNVNMGDFTPNTGCIHM